MLKSFFKMIDVGNKIPCRREALAAGKVIFSEAGFNELITKGSKKGDIVPHAEIAGILGAKYTPNLLPMCHPLPLDSVHVEVKPNHETKSVDVQAFAAAHAKTGVEMEALTAVSVSCLAVYDMCKNFDKSMRIENIHLVSKIKHEN
ncbi:unnamed protein product [Blepharisma stoltei]|uniref:Molybdopterin cofactor biosynthesis C (MoaC) domain-containing protein n=1 Tax=Blepharisma stoltei TaxID=1481888 RepID=A0AAU9JJA4_9CILI|nr:unnamed protein product [Blepharisma stoltei]